MCGILGYIKSGGNLSGWDKAFSSIQHRGPDATGVFDDAEIRMGTQRLKIQDLSALGDQPITDASGRYTIVFNGEIYNHPEIRKHLQRHGHVFKSNTDTETVLYGYITYGKSILQRLNGIFSFVIYDRNTKKLFGARDQMGVKPFYYFKKENKFSFASEIKSLIFLDNFDSTIDYAAFANYLHYLWSPGEKTPFLYVKKLLPGHYFEMQTGDAGSFHTEKYYDVPYTGAREYYTEKVWIDTIDRQLESSVRGQLLSDVPVGCFLSGGIDSSVVVAQARKHYAQADLHCFTIRSPEDSDHEGFRNDLKYAREAARHIGVTLHEVEGNVSVLDLFDRMVWHLDEPQGDIAPIYVYKVSEAAAAMGVKVLLSGAGGDDVFSGYRRHQALALDPWLQNTPDFIIPILERYLRTRDPNNPTVRRISKFIRRKSDSYVDRLVGLFEWYPISENYHLFHQDIQHSILSYDPEAYQTDLLQKIQEEDSMLNKMLYLDLKTFLPDHNLNYTDKMGMAASVEIRVPYLDTSLIQTSVKLPVDLKLKRNTTKYILRKVAERYLPPSIIQRSKTGFGGPVRKWISDDLRKMVDERLSPEGLSQYQIFNPDAMRKLIHDTRQGKVDGAYTILTAMAIQSWMDQFYAHKGYAG